MLKLIAVAVAILLSSCAIFQKPKPEIIITHKMVYPQLPHIYAPPKNSMDSISFDWPRLSNYYSVLNTSKCKDKFITIYPDSDPLGFRLKVDDPESRIELEQFPKFWNTCSIPSIDFDSNLYIGMTESEYKKLTTNIKITITREKQWQELLKRINSMLDGWREKANKEASK